MRTHKDSKAMAKSLREALAARNISLSHSECLEIVARQFGYTNWNTLSAKLAAEENRPTAELATQAVSPATEQISIGERVPVIPLRDAVVYPEMLMPIFIARRKSTLSVEAAMRGNRQVLFVTQRELDVQEPSAEDLYSIGTIATVMHDSNGRDGTTKLLIRGAARARIVQLHDEDHLSANITQLVEIDAKEDADVAELRRDLTARFKHHIQATGRASFAAVAPSKNLPFTDFLARVDRMDLGVFADTIAVHFPLELAQKQKVLEILDVAERLRYVDVLTVD